MDVKKNIDSLRTYIESEGFKGYDPYDALNSPLLRALSCNRKWLRIAFIQLLKRLPVNIRPMLGIQKDYNPKGLGLFLWGYAKLYKIEKKEEYLKRIHRIMECLYGAKSRGYSGNCWGYNFDWQSRAFYVPKNTPTIVNSSFIGHALIDTFLHTGNTQALDMAVPIKDFILNDLHRTAERNTFCFSYTPLDTIAVHNANLLGASLLIRLYKYVKEPDIKEAALASLAYSMKHQRDGGSWYYAETGYQKWIDSFHTGFNLQSLKYFIDEGFGNEYKNAFEEGTTFYKNNFFLDDGTPKYYHDSVYPIDIHSAAQAVVFFSKMGQDYRELSGRIAAWMVCNMQDKRGFFYFRQNRTYTNRIPYIRWGQSWTFHALTEYSLKNNQPA